MVSPPPHGNDSNVESKDSTGAALNKLLELRSHCSCLLFEERRRKNPKSQHRELTMAHQGDDQESLRTEDAKSEAALLWLDARGRAPPWREELTARSLVASLAIGAMYSVIVTKLSLPTGLVPTLNVSAVLIAFVLLRSWTHALARINVTTRPFTLQENNVVQT